MTGAAPPREDSSQHEPQALRSERFAVVRKLGEGGMGTVYEAVDRERFMRVALKTLRELSPEALLRFKGEFRKLQDLHHPNLVGLGELVEEQGRWFFTMELVHGGDFLSYVRGLSAEEALEPTLRQGSTSSESPTLPSEPIEPTEPTELAAPPPPEAPTYQPFNERRLRLGLSQLALGLHALHRAGKVHRDIKPSNLLVTAEGRVVLLDFGILSDVEGDETWSSSEIVGTSSYMAPEQARGAPPSPQADWYSVGVLLYQALTGRRPYVHPPQGALSELPRPPSPQSLVPGLPEDLTRLCEALLSPEPHLRPQGEEVLRHLGVEQAAREEAWATTALPFVGRRAELQALHQALAESQQGASVVVRVEGESGVGKSRLVRRFLEEVAQRHPEAVVLNGRCYERESVPYKGVDGVVDGLVRYLSSRGQELAPRVLTEELSALVRLFPVVRALGKPSGSEPEPGSPLQLRLSAFATLRRLLARLASHHPVVLSMEDVQWAAGDTVALLEEVLQAPGLLLVATRRRGLECPLPPGAQERRWWNGARVLSLEGLPPPEAMLLASELLARAEHGAPPGVEEVRRIAQESSGHPLFIEALVRYRQGEGERPVHLEEALWARVQRLEPGAQGLLELLAVAGGSVPQGVAARAVALGPSEYARLAASLRGAHLAVSSGPAERDRLELLHDRVREAVAPHLSAPARRQWHERLALALEETGQGGAEVLALHWREAGERERAARYSLQAAQEADRALAFSHAAHLYQQALELGAWEPEERRRLEVARAEALGHAGRGREAAEAFLALTQAATPAEARALRRRAAQYYLRSGYLDEGLATARQVLAELGLRYPAGRWEARLVGRLLRLWLWLKPQLRSMSLWRTPRPPSTPEREYLEVLHFLSASLLPTSPPQAAVFSTLYLLCTLDVDDPPHRCKALGLELIYQAMRKPPHSPRLIRLQQQLEQLASTFQEDVAIRCEARLRRAMQCNMQGSFADAWHHTQEALSLLPRVVGIPWMSNAALGAASVALGAMGELGELRRLLELPVAEAWERQDLLGLSILELGSSTLRWLAMDEPRRGREQADAVIALWTRRGRYLQHLNHTTSRVYVALYEGQPEEALRLLEPMWTQLERLRGSQGARSRLLEAYSRARLMAALGKAGAEAERLRHAALADAQALERMGLAHTRALAELVRAGVAAGRGEPRAAEAYGQAAQALEQGWLLLHAAAARWRQGELLGGEQGQRLVAEAEAWMRQRGIVRPERMAYMYAPAGSSRPILEELSQVG